MRFKIRLIKWNDRLVILVILFICLLVPSVTSAYITGREWDSIDPLYIKITWAPGYKSYVAFMYAKSDWDATSTPLDFEYHPYGYDVYCVEQLHPDVTWDGFYILYPYSGRITLADCILNKKYMDVYPLHWRISVAAHELGHALGLLDMERTDRVLMNWNSCFRYAIYQIYTPQQDDINGVNSMYD